VKHPPRPTRLEFSSFLLAFISSTRLSLTLVLNPFEYRRARPRNRNRTRPYALCVNGISHDLGESKRACSLTSRSTVSWMSQAPPPLLVAHISLRLTSRLRVTAAMGTRGPEFTCTLTRPGTSWDILTNFWLVPIDFIAHNLIAGSGLLFFFLFKLPSNELELQPALRSQLGCRSRV